ncbi:hypothetical protein ACOIXV_003173 [Vibrio parahaemolyticus]
MIYVKSAIQESEIIVFGKSEEQITQDIESGLSRFGGNFRQPSYSRAYLNSAKVLLGNAISTKQLDEYGLPIFYMARHALELKLKDLLGLAYDVLKMRDELYKSKRSKEELPSNKRLKRFETSHDIGKLYQDLKHSCAQLDIDIPNTAFTTVIENIQSHEVTPTWSRYNKSDKGLHVANEVVLPIVRLVKDLESLFKAVSCDLDGYGDTVESELYSEFNHLTGRLENP